MIVADSARFRAFAKFDFNDGRRHIYATTAVTMTGKTCNQRASLILLLMVLILDMLCVSVVGQVRGSALAFRTFINGAKTSPLPPLPLPPQEFLSLLASYHCMLQRLQSREPWTLRKLDACHRELVQEFVARFETFGGKIVCLLHCPASLFETLRSMGFSKLHCVEHETGKVAALGPPWYTSLGTCKLAGAVCACMCACVCLCMLTRWLAMACVSDCAQAHGRQP